MWHHCRGHYHNDCLLRANKDLIAETDTLAIHSSCLGKQDRCCYVNSSLATTLSSHTHSDWMAYATLCCLGSFEHLNCQVVTCENVLTSGDHFCRLPSWHHRSLKQGFSAVAVEAAHSKSQVIISRGHMVKHFPYLGHNDRTNRS